MYVKPVVHNSPPFQSFCGPPYVSNCWAPEPGMQEESFHGSMTCHYENFQATRSCSPTVQTSINGNLVGKSIKLGQQSLRRDYS